MESNNITQHSKTELASQLPDLVEWIKNEFPEREIEYRNKIFTFHGDVPINAMEDIAASNLSGVSRCAYLLKILSISPKITDEVLAIMGSTMLMELYDSLFPKKEPVSSPAESINTISSVAP